MLKKLLSILLVVISLLFVACGDTGDDYNAPGSNYKKRPETYTTNYTDQEHVQRLKQITEKVYVCRGVEGKKHNELVDIEAYVVYSYDERPEMFYIILTYAKPIEYQNHLGEDKETCFFHNFGFIENDEYYLARENEEGKGFWGENNLLDKKKYSTLWNNFGYYDDSGNLKVYDYDYRTGASNLKEGVSVSELIDISKLEMREGPIQKYSRELTIDDLRAVGTGYGQVRPTTFTTNYTKEEHVERIEERAWDIVERIGPVYYADYNDDGVRDGENNVVDIQAYIVYSFDDRPEYFYIIYEYEKEIHIRFRDENVRTKFSHQFGYIENDEYKMFYPNNIYSHNLGKGFWGENDLLEEKKYFCYNVQCFGYKDANEQFIKYQGWGEEYKKANYVISDMSVYELIQETKLERRGENKIFA